MQIAVDKKASKKTQELLNYLNQVAGKKMITGQHTQTNPMEEITYIEELTGKKPKLFGFELLAYSPNINYEDASEPCLTEVYENRNTLDIEAINIGALEVFDNDTEVTIEKLIETGIIKSAKDGVKVLGNGTLTKKLTVKVNAYSESAKAKIEELGGKAEVI